MRKILLMLVLLALSAVTASAREHCLWYGQPARHWLEALPIGNSALCAMVYGGTYAQPHGGEFSVVARAWIDWQLKGDKKAAKMFKGSDCELLKRKDWSIEKNALFDKLK